jgi:hypothetical protein
MSTQQVERSGAASESTADRLPDQLLMPWWRSSRVWRWIATTLWLGVVVAHLIFLGLAFDRTRLILLMCLGLAAASIGRRRVTTVIIDWLPFAGILLLYDFTRNIAQWMGMPTHWSLAADFDHIMFGVNPTVWLQAHLKQPDAPWWEVVTSVVYMSYFIIPYAAAAVLWLRNRHAWRRYAAGFLIMTFVALVGYTLLPAAPPWAAARCTSEQVADHPRAPECMNQLYADGGGLLGKLEPQNAGAQPYVERISARGWEVLDIHAASNLLQLGQAKANLVAAIPSLHAGLTMFLALFMWPRVRALGRTLFLGYAVAMAFTLVYTAEHYVLDIFLGWGLAAAVVVGVGVVDKRSIARRNRSPVPQSL